eukprot:TRINITY_DN3271_c0_g1_i1.p1 TRINITY_DN3271_c0_g1~~TRINITY_DN3271_c0_g1_i1.p1  ORF type:complete len:1134 (-),score=258.53 TRINITY_DN3271_c0_g1_i1:27-2993(-)
MIASYEKGTKNGRQLDLAFIEDAIAGGFYERNPNVRPHNAPANWSSDSAIHAAATSSAPSSAPSSVSSSPAAISGFASNSSSSAAVASAAQPDIVEQRTTDDLGERRRSSSGAVAALLLQQEQNEQHRLSEPGAADDDDDGADADPVGLESPAIGALPLIPPAVSVELLSRSAQRTMTTAAGISALLFPVLVHVLCNSPLVHSVLTPTVGAIHVPPGVCASLAAVALVSSLSALILFVLLTLRAPTDTSLATLFFPARHVASQHPGTATPPVVSAASSPVLRSAAKPETSLLHPSANSLAAAVAALSDVGPTNPRSSVPRGRRGSGRAFSPQSRQPRMPETVVSASVPAWMMQLWLGKPQVVFVVQVHAASGAVWSVTRTFDELRELSHIVRLLHGLIRPPLPTNATGTAAETQPRGEPEAFVQVSDDTVPDLLSYTFDQQQEFDVNKLEIREIETLRELLQTYLAALMVSHAQAVRQSHVVDLFLQLDEGTHFAPFSKPGSELAPLLGDAERALYTKLARPSVDDLLWEGVITRAQWRSFWSDDWIILTKIGVVVSSVRNNKTDTFFIPVSDIVSVSWVDQLRGPFLSYLFLEISTVEQSHYFCCADTATDSARLKSFADTLQKCLSESRAPAPTRDLTLASVLGKMSQKQTSPNDVIVMNRWKLWRESPRHRTEVIEDLFVRAQALFKEASDNSPAQGSLLDDVTFAPRFLVFAKLSSELQCIGLLGMLHKEAMSFFLNLYHIMVMHALMQFGAPGLPKTNGFFRRCAYEIGGHVLTIAEVEHAILRAPLHRPKVAGFLGLKARVIDSQVPQFKPSDPRTRLSLVIGDPALNFVLNNGCKSAGNIEIAFYRAETLEHQISSTASRFCDREVEVLSREKLVLLPKVCEWYTSDFGGKLEMIRFVCECLSESPKKFALALLLQEEAKSLKTKFRDFDWSFPTRLVYPDTLWAAPLSGPAAVGAATSSLTASLNDRSSTRSRPSSVRLS